MIGLVAFSFASRPLAEPNPCCVRLAAAAAAIIVREPEPVLVTAQWEVALALEALGVPVAATADLLPDGTYLDSAAVWHCLKPVLAARGVTHVIPVAQPFLQLTKVERLIARDGFVVVRRRLGRIGFDPQSTQWWTRGPLRLALYALIQALTGYHGHRGRQQAA